MDRKQASSKRYPPELKERAVKMGRRASAGGPRRPPVISRWRASGCRTGVVAPVGQAADVDAGHEGPGSHHRGAGGAEAAAQGELRAATGQRHLAVGRDFLRGGARRRGRGSRLHRRPPGPRDRWARWGVSRSASSCRSPPPPTYGPKVPAPFRPEPSVTPRSARSCRAVEAQLLLRRSEPEADPDEGLWKAGPHALPEFGPRDSLRGRHRRFVNDAAPASAHGRKCALKNDP